MDDEGDYKFVINTTSSYTEKNGVCEVPADALHMERKEVKLEHLNNEEDIKEVEETTIIKDQYIKKNGVCEVPADALHMERKEVKLEHLNNEEDIKEFEETTIIKDQNNEKKKSQIFASVPIVFTTRLDDMPIFNQKNLFSFSKAILNRILKESAPKYSNQKPVAKPYSKLSYQALKKKLCEMSTKIKTSDTKRKKNIKNTNIDSEVQLADNMYIQNAKLIKMCKPLSIRLERLSFLEQSGYQLARKCTVGQCFVFQEYFSNETNIYCIQNDNITENCTLKNANDSTILSYITAYNKLGFMSKRVEFCCWHQRSQYIVSLNSRYFITHVKDFMKKPHNCVYGRCICCCRPWSDNTITKESTKRDSTLVNITPEDIEITDLEKEISETLQGITNKSNVYGYSNDWLEKLLDGTSRGETFVDKALNYTRLSPDSKKDETSKPIFKNDTSKSVIRFYNDSKVEFYELQQNSNVVAYLKENTKTTKIAKDYQKSFKPRNMVSESIFRSCCWYGREEIIIDCQIPGFTKLPHTCLPGDCKCCCKPQEPIALAPLVDIVFSKSNFPRDRCNIRSVSGKSKQNKSKKSSVSNTETTKKYIKILPKPSTSKIPARNEANMALINSPNIIQQNAIKQPQSDTAITTTISKIASDKSCIEGPPKSVPVPPTADSCQELAVDSMISTILDRFKDVRLTINEDGKVAAALSSPVDTLNTAELKVLANILSHAQKQVKALGLRPGSLLNSNNVEKQANTETQAQILPEEPVAINTHSQGSFIKSATVDTPSPLEQTSGPSQEQCKIYLNREHQKISYNTTPKPEILSEFSNMSQLNRHSLLQSYSSYIENKEKVQKNTVMSDSNEPLIPIISNVFSLKDVENDSVLSANVKLDSMSSTEISEGEMIRKRKIVDAEPKPQSKIRVVDPEKLGIKPQNSILEAVLTKERKMSQFKVLNENLIDTPSLPLQQTFIPAPINTAVQSLPVISNVTGNAEQYLTTVTNTQNNILVINPLQPLDSVTGGQVFISSSNANNIQVVAPMSINTIASNVPMLPHTTSGTVFTISNLDETPTAEPLLNAAPRLLNAEPVVQPRRFTTSPPPLAPVTIKPTNNIKNHVKKKIRGVLYNVS